LNNLMGTGVTSCTLSGTAQPICQSIASAAVRISN